MAGKISDAEKKLKVGNKFNSNMVKISSKSILSYQNGSALNIENREETADEGVTGTGCPEDVTNSQETFSENQNLKHDCLDILRKKLISDLSLTIFSPDLENKLAKMEPIEISKERQSVIQKILVQISQLSDAEKLLLFLKLPSSTSSPFDPLRQPLNPLGNRQEIQQTIVWIKTHLEEDSEISIPKQDVYDQYLKYCENVSMKPLSTADFGKVMKQVYPGVRPRRLGTRGNSRYCYSGMRNTCKLPTPILPTSTTENSVSNGISNDGPSLTVEGNKCKKVDKTKRKLKSISCRNDKSSTFIQGCQNEEKSADVKNVKRPKMEGKETEVQEVGEMGIQSTAGTAAEGIKKEVEQCRIKCEENSENSFSTFEIECGLDSDFGIYLKNMEKVGRGSPTGSNSFVSDSSSGIDSKGKQNESQSSLFSSNDSSVTVDQSNCSEGNLVSPIDNGQGDKTNASQTPARGKVNGVDGTKNSIFDQRKSSKARVRRSASFSKPPKNLRKSYVPIQPKPLDIQKLNVLFEQPVGISQYPPNQKQESEGPSLCDESDSQEPEEEIVRYFKHLDENELSSNNLVEQTVKNIDRISAQNNNSSQAPSKKSANYLRGGEVLNNANQQLLRSQSCFEVQRQLFNINENSESVHVPRSQSSVELPSSMEPQREAMDMESGANWKNKKISHLRILLEKSICTGNKIPFSGLRESSNVLLNGNPVISNAQEGHSVSQGPPNEPNCLLSQSKRIPNDLLKLNGLKVVSSGPSYVPQSPNNRTKYFSFTPISPGPQSPLKTPSTPSASPFVSPRNTPVPRCRQNSSYDFFLSPSERKSTSRPDSGKIEFMNDSEINAKTLSGNFRPERNKPPYLQACRPRSFSSTNFCRSKPRRNSSKLIGFEDAMNFAPNSVQTVAQNNFLINSQFSIHKNFVSSESLSNEIRKFLENNSSVTEDQSATIRSQSVPLNRMISESTWTPSHMGTVNSGYFNSGSSNPPLTPLCGKVFEWPSNSIKNLVTTVPPFLTNGDMNSMGPNPLDNEVFTGDPSIAQLDDQFFTTDFRSGNNETLTENNPFQEESAFSNKLDLNSGTFDSPFTSESDTGIADNIKTYLPDFEGLDNKSMDNGEVLNDRKILKTQLYERGNDNIKDPVITSFKPLITNEISSCPGSPVLNFFGSKMNEDNQQLIELFDFEN